MSVFRTNHCRWLNVCLDCEGCLGSCCCCSIVFTQHNVHNTLTGACKSFLMLHLYCENFATMWFCATQINIVWLIDMWSQKKKSKFPSLCTPFFFFRPTSPSSRMSCPTTSSCTPPWTPSSSTRTRSSSTSSPRRTEPRSYCITSVRPPNSKWS